MATVTDLARWDVELGLGADPLRLEDEEYREAFLTAKAEKTRRYNDERTAALGRTLEFLGLEG